MNVEFYTGVDERLPVPMILPPVPELVDLHDARMLIADDVADTGQTLALVKGFCAGQVGEVRTAVLYEKSARSSLRLSLAANGALDRLPVVRTSRPVSDRANGGRATSPGSACRPTCCFEKTSVPVDEDVELALLALVESTLRARSPSARPRDSRPDRRNRFRRGSRRSRRSRREL